MLGRTAHRQASASRIRVLTCLAAFGAGCAPQLQSPREPYALTAAPVAEQETAPAFRILDDWRWGDTPDTPGSAVGIRALDRAAIGLFPGARFRIATGHCRDCDVPAAALWWFRDEVIAVPRRPVRSAARRSPVELPSIVWLGAPDIISDAQLSDDAQSVRIDGRAVPLAVPPPIPTNRTYVDAATARFFAGRPLRIRGASDRANGFVARTIWPDDLRLDVAGLELEPLRDNELLGSLIEAQMAAAGESPSRLLFRRDAARRARDDGGRAVLAFVLTGAQGDDDGARAGHLAAATGWLGPDGAWSDWLVDNFYPLLETSAKGIIPASLPMDNYLFDLNSGQLLYRPGYMLVAVLARNRVPRAIHAALHRTMLDLYCGEVQFDRAGFNSTAMTIDSLRELGWRIPSTGPTSRVAGVVAAPLAAAAQLSLARGREAFAALATERTRLLPRVAFEVAGHDLLEIAAGNSGDLTHFERMLAEDLEAIMFVRLPQVPSSRRFGSYPARSLLTYGSGVLAKPGDVERAPEADPREPPAHLARSCPR